MLSEKSQMERVHSIIQVIQSSKAGKLHREWSLMCKYNHVSMERKWLKRGIIRDFRRLGIFCLWLYDRSCHVACSTCENPTNFVLMSYALIWIHYTSIKVCKKLHIRKKTFMNYWKFILILASFTYLPSMKRVTYLTEIVFSGADWNPNGLCIAYLGSLREGTS